MLVTPPKIEAEFRRDRFRVPAALVDVIPVNAPVAEAADKHRGILSCGEQERLARFTQAQDAASYLVAHVYLRLALGEALGTDPAGLTFGRSPCPDCGSTSGRPMVASSNGLEFSLSHTVGAVAVALSSSRVGVDIQAVGGGGHVGVLNALHPHEARFLRSLEADRREAALVRCWTRKEAVLKGLGSGVAHGVRTPLVGASESPGVVRGWCVYDVPVAPDWAAAVAYEAPTVDHPTPRTAGSNMGGSHDRNC